MEAAVGTVLTLSGESGPAAVALRRFALELERARTGAPDAHGAAYAALREAPGDTSALQSVARYTLASPTTGSPAT